MGLAKRYEPGTMEPALRDFWQSDYRQSTDFYLEETEQTTPPTGKDQHLDAQTRSSTGDSRASSGSDESDSGQTLTGFDPSECLLHNVDYTNLN